MFFPEVTPLIANPDTIRAARIYPGGENLDRMFGRKPVPEPGWYYPEAWLFSPVAAINPGSARSDEGMTRIYDRDGGSRTWAEFVRAYGSGVTGPRPVKVIVKILDGSITLPKEFHFRGVDEPALRSYEAVRNFTGTLTKPEIWIRHPAAPGEPEPSYLGFREPITHTELYHVWKEGPSALERRMNAVRINPGTGLYIPGGIVHSLGPGLYFEVLADGDLKITLQEQFAGRSLTRAEQLGLLYTGAEDDMRRAIELVDLSAAGDDVVSRAIRRPRPVGNYREELLRSAPFEVEWITVPPRASFELRNTDPARPHIFVAARGLGEIQTEVASVPVAPVGSTFEEFSSGAPCLGAVVHYETPCVSIENRGNDPLVVLHVCEPEGKQL